MYRTLFAGLRYPGIDDTVSHQSLVDLATDIQWCTDRNQRRVDELKRRRGVRVSAPGTQILGSGGWVTAQWSVEQFDTDGYVDLGVSNTNINVQVGWYHVCFTATIVGNGAALSSIYGAISGSVSGIFVAKASGPYNSLTSGMVSMSSVIYSPGEVLTVTVRQVSGGNGTLFGGDFHLARIGGG